MRKLVVIGSMHRNALKRLCAVALRDTGQSKKVADFLLAWHNAAENGGWNPADLWGVDDTIAADMLDVLTLVGESQQYPGDLGFEKEVKAIWEQWRSPKIAEPPKDAEAAPTLIAAAPDLLEACRQAALVIESLPNEGSVYEVLDAAIAKAEGRA